MDFWHWLGGMVTVRLLSADRERAMHRLLKQGFPVYNAEALDDGITLCFQVKNRDYPVLAHLVKKYGYTLELQRKSGFVKWLRSMLARPVLVLGIGFFLILGLLLPTRIFFFRVEGNSYVPTNRILAECAQTGVGFGASRELLRSEKVKNGILQAIPQLKWVGVNTSGCVATITVKERTLEEKSQQVSGVSSIVALRDGVITSCTAYKGNLLCKPGQGVKAGQVLISGYIDCGATIQVTDAAGEVFAQTKRSLQVVTPANAVQKQEIFVLAKKYSVIFGKKRINFYQGSGISPQGCAKMYEERYVTLPGGFVLPLAIVTETLYSYSQAALSISQEQAYTITREYAKNYTLSSMLAGRIMHAQENFSDNQERYCLEVDYACNEMIGLYKNEEIILPNGNNS